MPSQGAEYTRRFRADAPLPRTPTQKITSVAQLLALVDRASSARLREPDLAMNLRIADIINEKKGVYPREVAMHLAKLANSWSVQNALLALSILDVCVKNCGYPFHLAVSRRDFLNLLVKGFPEHPPLRYTQVQMLILQMLEEWNLTLAKVGRHREDLSSIRDMHRLLALKGYMFPEADRAELAALMPQENELKSAEELEQEDREAQSAKLQELIRSGAPEDLKEANRLMSVMSGFKDTSEEYRAREALEIQNLEDKLLLAEEMRLANSTDDVLQELETALNRALPKLRSMEPPRMDLVARIEGLANKQVDLLNLGDTGEVSLPTDVFGAAPTSNQSANSSTTTNAAANSNSTAQPANQLLDIFGDSNPPANSQASTNATNTATIDTAVTTVFNESGLRISYTAQKLPNGVCFEFMYTQPVEMQFAPAKNLNLRVDPLFEGKQMVQLTFSEPKPLKLRWRAVGKGEGVVVYN